MPNTRGNIGYWSLDTTLTYAVFHLPYSYCTQIIFSSVFWPTSFWLLWARIVHSVYLLTTDWTVGGSNPGRKKFSAPIHTGSVSHTLSYALGIGIYRWVKWLVNGINHPPHLENRAIHLLPLCAFMAGCRMNFTFVILVTSNQSLKFNIHPILCIWHNPEVNCIVNVSE
jgi:hypothetical protein